MNHVRVECWWKIKKKFRLNIAERKTDRNKKFTSSSSKFVRPIPHDPVCVGELVRMADYRLTIWPVNVWPLDPDQFPINPSNVANLPIDHPLSRNPLNIPLPQYEHQCTDRMLHNCDRSSDWMVNGHTFVIFVELSGKKRSPNICRMEVVSQGSIDASPLPEPIYEEIVSAKWNKNSINFHYLASADKFSAVIGAPCCTTEMTGVIDSPSASTNAAR